METGRTHWHRLALITTALSFMWPVGAHAQERLVGQRSFGASATYDVVNFGDDGLLQGAFAGHGALRIRRVQQLTIPVSTTIPIGKSWTFDATTLFASGTVTYDLVSGAADRTATLSGVSDVRMRASGHLFTDGLILTVGVNAPSGKTKLDTASLLALRGLAAPALGLGSSPVGSGPSGTVGLLAVREAGAWALAVGGSYEYRGSFQPITALVAGAPSTDFVPGGVIRASIGVDRTIGKGRLSLTSSADIFAEDHLRIAGAAATVFGDGTLARVHLGPLFSSDAQLHLTPAHTRDLLLWASHRWRSAFSREGLTVEGTSGHYVDGGVTSVFPMTGHVDLTTALAGRWHSGLSIDEGLPTAGVRSGSFTLGLSGHSAGFEWQPFARVQAGRVQARGAARLAQNATFTGASFGLTLVSHF